MPAKLASATPTYRRAGSIRPRRPGQQPDGVVDGGSDREDDDRDAIEPGLEMARRVDQDQRDQADEHNVGKRGADGVEQREFGQLQVADQPGEPDEGHEAAGRVGRAARPDGEPAEEIGPADREVAQHVGRLGARAVVEGLARQAPGEPDDADDRADPGRPWRDSDIDGGVPVSGQALSVGGPGRTVAARHHPARLDQRRASVAQPTGCPVGVGACAALRMIHAPSQQSAAPNARLPNR